MTCPDCERYKQSASMWRNKAYELGGTPLPWEPEELLRKEYERGFIDGMQKQMQSSVDKAVNAMAQPAPVLTGIDCSCGRKWRVVNNTLTASEQPEQEPVAWMHNHIEGNVIAHRPADIDRHPERWTALYPEPKPCPTCEALARTVMLDQTYHDTITSQRTWVGLTDEEIMSLLPVTEHKPATTFARAIEAKLKEKNGA